MTICVSAICNGGEHAVVATDRMITASFPPIKFEHTRPKIHKLCEYCVVMTAGDALRPMEVIPKSTAVVADQKNPPLVDAIVDIVKNWYQFHRMARAEELFLKPRTIDAKTFYSQGSTIFPRDVFGYLDETFTSFDYGLDMLLAGVDSKGAHIYSIHNPGVSNCYDTLGFHAIGIGQMYAVQAFIARRYDLSCDLAECLQVVYAAKKTAEAAPGVGTDTDVSILGGDTVHSLDQSFVKNLENIYTKVTKPRGTEIKKAIEMLNKAIEKEKERKKDKETERKNAAE